MDLALNILTAMVRQDLQLRENTLAPAPHKDGLRTPKSNTALDHVNSGPTRARVAACPGGCSPPAPGLWEKGGPIP